MSSNFKYSLYHESESLISKEANFVIIDFLTDIGKKIVLPYEIKELSSHAITSGLKKSR